MGRKILGALVVVLLGACASTAAATESPVATGGFSDAQTILGSSLVPASGTYRARSRCWTTRRPEPPRSTCRASRSAR